MKWQAIAPSNIALIKYMGCQKEGERLPANPSFSYTLEQLTSRVELELSESASQDSWQAFADDTQAPMLSATEQARFLNHLSFLKKQFNFKGHFIVRSANNFHSACGLASSASSFAALTLCAAKALSATCSRELLANWSRQASGSSCRSFFGPWVRWEGESVAAVDLPYSELMHRVVLVDTQKKAISSSEAHRRVLSSPLFLDRPQRASERLTQLLQSMRAQDWTKMHEIVWDEFLDMHRLFETAEEKFSYRQAGTLRVLDYLQDFWQKNSDGPLVTMDAGPNVHLLFRPDQAEMAAAIFTATKGLL